MAAHNFPIQDIEKVMTNIDGEIKKIDATRLTAPGENFLSLVFRVDFHVEKNGKSQIISAVAKRLPTGKNNVDFHATAMKNEIRWYSEMVPLLKEFANEINLDVDYYPDYFGARFSGDATKTYADQESVLLLHNLIPEGYRNEDRYVGFDVIAAKAVLSTLANFHAVPLIMKSKRPDLAKTVKEFYASSAIKTPGKDGPPKCLPIGLLFDMMLEDPQFKAYKGKVENLKNALRGPDSLRKPGSELWRTNVHRDFWVNNVLVKPGEGGVPLVKIVDFQLTVYSSYAMDVVFFLLTSIKNDVMKQHFDDFLRHYYEELTSIIENAGVSDLKLAYDEYLEELKRVALESEVSRAMFFSTVVFGGKRNVPDALTDELDMFAHLEKMVRRINENDKQKQRLMVILELTEAVGWI